MVGRHPAGLGLAARRALLLNDHQVAAISPTMRADMMGDAQFAALGAGDKVWQMQALLGSPMTLT
jgi:hypothetical protein